MQLTYQVDGEPLERLPDGYSAHYVPDGFERDREQEFESAENFFTFTRQKEAVKDILFDAPLYSRGNSPRLTMSIQLMRT